MYGPKTQVYALKMPVLQLRTCLRDCHLWSLSPDLQNNLLFLWQQGLKANFLPRAWPFKCPFVTFLCCHHLISAGEKEPEVCLGSLLAETEDKSHLIPRLTWTRSSSTRFSEWVKLTVVNEFILLHYILSVYRYLNQTIKVHRSTLHWAGCYQISCGLLFVLILHRALYF